MNVKRGPCSESPREGRDGQVAHDGIPGSTTSPRLEDVARRARVSTATVSRVLNSPADVSEGLRARVESAVAALGYVPHGAARALASRRSHTIGAIIPTIENAIFARGVQALQGALYEAGYTLLLASSDYDSAREMRALRSLIARGIDGLLLVGESRSRSAYELMQAKGIPYVNTWIYRHNSRHPCIGFDNRAAARRMADLLLDLGHRNIAMLSGRTRDNDRARQRVEGVQASLAARGLGLPAAHLLERPYDIDAARAATRDLLETSTPPSAILCGMDTLAVGALLECRARGLRIPHDISITGFDDLELASAVEPPLTTMRVPSGEMGTVAAEYLLARIAGHEVQSRVRLEAVLVERGSTAAPRR